MRPPPAPSLHLPTVTVSFTRRAARERKREASEIPEWIDRCYVIGAASSTPQEARSWGERGSPAAGATRTVSPPHRSLELDIQEAAASFVFWCHRRWPLMAFGLLTWGGWVLQHPPTLLPPCVRQSHIQHHGQLPGARLPLTYHSQGHPRTSQLKRWGFDLLLFPRSEGHPATSSKPPGCGNREEEGAIPATLHLHPPPLLIRHSAPSFRSLSLICMHLHNTVHLHSRRLMVEARKKGEGGWRREKKGEILFSSKCWGRD
uniref:protein CROC-4 isoform X1 n=1 Tax=Macaca mulatta TaxID=9544 RepID=UPI00073281C5|nr:protein CROC-4 isoform X1 [Macaca mulatta]XP_028683540.1 protein CROC-4 isoform X1 [Macaca mulatta]